MDPPAEASTSEARGVSDPVWKENHLAETCLSSWPAQQ